MEDNKKSSILGQYRIYDVVEENERERQRELEQIKRAKLGIDDSKKKRTFQKNKNKPLFDWDPEEDTSDYSSSIWTEREQFRPQFGRGFFAGVDKYEQVKNFRNSLTSRERKLLDAKKKVLSDKVLEALKRNKSSSEVLLKQIEKEEQRDRHWRNKTLEEMTQRDWRIFREDYNITTKGGKIPNPIRCWPELKVDDWILKAIDDAGYRYPTPIQMQAIPIGLQNRDLVGVAETGSGKTVAYLIPMLHYISKLPRLDKSTEIDGPYALILVPSRELALQIEEEVRRFAKYNDYRVVALVGGQPIEEQAMLLRKGCEIIVATPGRLIDCIDRRYTVLNQCNYVVLDEGDRMITMGFESQIIQILESMPKENLKSTDDTEAEKQEADLKSIYRTTILFSATMPLAVERLAQKYLRRPAYVYIGEVGKVVDRIKQYVIFTKNIGEKRNQLLSQLEFGPRPPIIVFCNLKKTCDEVAKLLRDNGYRVSVLHSSKSQEQRERSLEEFKKGAVDILIATDIAGRGLHVEGVTHVINFDLPKTIEDYTHRIGRTGRAGESGIATSFLTNEDTDIMYDLRQTLEKSGNPVPKELESHPASSQKPGTIAAPTRRGETIIYIQ